MKTGIYTITNLINNKIYVGSTSIYFSKRKASHFWELNNNLHPNKHLQSAFNKYGKENFIFEILEECLPEYCLSQEIWWINMLNTKDDKFGYNILQPFKGRLGVEHTQETKDKIGKANKGKIRSKQQRKQLSISRKGKFKGENSSLYGKKQSDISKEKRSKSLKGRKSDKIKKVYQYDKQNNFINEYNSITEACLINNYKSNGTMSNCCLNKIKSYMGYIWKYNKDKIIK